MVKPEYRTEAISIRSPLTRGDTARRTLATTARHFNPLPSYEGRPAAPSGQSICGNFNPLPSYEGRPSGCCMIATSSRNFNPLPSYEGRLVQHVLFLHQNNFNPLPSYEGRRLTGGERH